MSIKNTMIDTIKKYHLIENGDKIVVGVSGGPDSICLLEHLNEMRKCPQWLFSTKQKHSQINNQPAGTFEIVVAHVNHMLRKEAKEDEQYVKAYCQKNGIEFYSKSIDVEKIAHTKKIGTEEAGRLVRYEFFEEVLQNTKATKIAIAHHKDDKIETIFMHILRGSGVEGLKGIEPIRNNIIRPLIECERAEIEQYCKEKQLNPRIDQTNMDNSYQRNKIRNTVIPYIKKEFNPNIIKTMDRLSHIVTLEDQYLEKQVREIYQEIVIQEQQKEIQLDLKKFNWQDKVIKSRLIRYIIKRLLGSTASIEKIHIDDVIKLCANNIGNKYLTPNKNIKVLVKNQKIFFQFLGNSFNLPK